MRRINKGILCFCIVLLLVGCNNGNKDNANDSETIELITDLGSYGEEIVKMSYDQFFTYNLKNIQGRTLVIDFIVDGVVVQNYLTRVIPLEGNNITNEVLMIGFNFETKVSATITMSENWAEEDENSSGFIHAYSKIPPEQLIETEVESFMYMKDQPSTYDLDNDIVILGAIVLSASDQLSSVFYNVNQDTKYEDVLSQIGSNAAIDYCYLITLQ